MWETKIGTYCLMSILYFSQSSYLFSLCQFLFIFYVLIPHLFFLQTINVLVFSPIISNKSINLNHISPRVIQYMNLSFYVTYHTVTLSYTKCKHFITLNIISNYTKFVIVGLNIFVVSNWNSLPSRMLIYFCSQTVNMNKYNYFNVIMLNYFDV